jgi:hypothetical protein
MVDVSSIQPIDADDVADDTVVELPNLVDGDLADMLAAASAPGLPSELSWEHGARSMFRSAVASWPNRRHLRRPAWAALAVASVAGLFATTTALAAASALPAPAERVVDGALNQVDINLAQPASNPGQVSAAKPKSTTRGGSRKPVETRGRTPQGRPAAANNCHRTVAGSNSSSVDGSARLSRPVSCAVQSGSAGHAGSSASTGPGLNRSGNQASGTGTSRGGNKGTGSGSGSGTGSGTSRGGNQGTGSGSGSGTSRGGNQGTGSGSGSGTSRGGNKGTGSGSGSGTRRGGNKGTGTGKGAGTGPGHHHRGTAVPGPSSSDPSSTIGNGTTIVP